MSAMVSQITSVPIVNSTVWPAADQRKHQSSVLLVFVRGIYQWPVNSTHKGPVTRKMFPFGDVIIIRRNVEYSMMPPSTISTCVMEVVLSHRCPASSSRRSTRSGDHQTTRDLKEGGEVYLALVCMIFILMFCELMPSNSLHNRALATGNTMAFNRIFVGKYRREFHGSYNNDTVSNLIGRFALLGGGGDVRDIKSIPLRLDLWWKRF